MKVMKTSSLLGIFLLTLMVTTVGCGKKNKSGTNTNPFAFSPLGNFPGAAGVGAIPGSITNPFAQQIFQFLPCLNGQQRAGIQVGLNMSVAVNATYIGITSEGDIAVVGPAGNGQAVMSAFICLRPEFSGQGRLTANPAIGRSSAGCLIDEISAARMVLPTLQGFSLTLNFRPIHFGVPGFPQFSQAISQICRGF